MVIQAEKMLFCIGNYVMINKPIHNCKSVWAFAYGISVSVLVIFAFFFFFTSPGKLVEVEFI